MQQLGDWERREGASRSPSGAVGLVGHVAESLSGHAGAKHAKSNIPECDEADGCG